MKIDRVNKQIIPTNAYDVFNIWEDPTCLDYNAGGGMCANFAAQRYANVSSTEADDWSLHFTLSGHEMLFRDLSEAFDQYVDYSFETGQDSNDGLSRSLRDPENAILRVAEAFTRNPELFKLIIDENEDGMLFVELTNKMSDRFTFTILEDYSIFWAFHEWQEMKWESAAKAAKKASADRFLARL